MIIKHLEIKQIASKKNNHVVFQVHFLFSDHEFLFEYFSLTAGYCGVCYSTHGSLGSPQIKNLEMSNQENWLCN